MEDFEIELDNNSEIMVDLDNDEQDLFNGVVLDATKRKRTNNPSMNDRPVEAPVSSFMAFANHGKQTPSARPPPPQEEPEDHGEGFGDDYGGGVGLEGGYDEDAPSPGYKSIDDEKADLLNKITRLEKKGIRSIERLNMHSSIHDIRGEVKRMSYSIEVDQSVKMQRRMLIACVTGIEFLNKRYNPLDIHLDGWSESVMDGVDDYDDVFEELYIKYRGKAKMAPELKLMMMLGGSATMFHLTHSMFKSAMPQMNDVIKQNPDLIKNMMSAVANTAKTAQARNVDPRPPPPIARREVQGPSMDLSSLMSNFMNPQSTTTRDVEEIRPPAGPSSDGNIEDDISDIVSVNGESVKDVEVSAPKKKRGKKGKTTLEL
jgi:hypothetical protein